MTFFIYIYLVAFEVKALCGRPKHIGKTIELLSSLICFGALCCMLKAWSNTIMLPSSRTYEA